MKAKISRIAIGYAPNKNHQTFKVAFNPLEVEIINGIVKLSGLPEGLDEETALRDLAWSLREKSNKTRTHSKVILAAIEAKLNTYQQKFLLTKKKKILTNL